jgi:DNA-binding YbaB/EbfC family protein
VGSKGRGRFQAPRGPSMMRQQVEQLQQQMAQAQAALEEAVVTATAGGGAVTIEMSGSQQLRSIKIKPEILDPEDVEMLQDLLLAAFNEAMAKSHQLAEERLGPLAGGLDLPGLF